MRTYLWRGSASALALSLGALLGGCDSADPAPGSLQGPAEAANSVYCPMPPPIAVTADPTYGFVILGPASDPGPIESDEKQGPAAGAADHSSSVYYIVNRRIRYMGSWGNWVTIGMTSTGTYVDQAWRVASGSTQFLAQYSFHNRCGDPTPVSAPRYSPQFYVY